jgi:hypothetical protein
MFHFLTKLTLFRLRRHLQALTANVEQPTVVRAAQSAIFDIAVLQRSSAMRAVLAQQSNSAELIAKQDQVFAKDFDRPRNVVELLSRSDHNPIAAKPLATRRTWTHMRYVGQHTFLNFSFRA